MDPIAHMLQMHPFLVLDGAMATELERRGCDLNDPLWSAKILLEAPELIRQVHADYFAAGADVTITASYQATFEGFASRGLERAVAAALMQQSVRLALEARDHFWANRGNRVGRSRPLVAASVGPYGAFLANGAEYRGDYGLSEEALMEFHRPRMEVLAAAGADLFACETIPCLTEARALARLLPEFPEMWAWISFTARDEKTIAQGESFADCVALLEAYPQIAALGINCTAPRYLNGLIRTARRVTTRPIVVYPNSGEEYKVASRSWSGECSSADFGAQARTWYALGAQLIGGCCRTTPDHIRAVRSILYT
ncbi:homocysteine S-methyltransferase [Candidatus Chloroploca sp. Khr17]|uniref:homocysteine S-methyltransferase n=1 Tax=Candidatus Chloroploca sp. Khr17 TaxID=2496869 RepID=UPI00101C11E2|nr:homocysteine S-methyltransferase [Candidatus Chloroploca sp. Khr17]